MRGRWVLTSPLLLVAAMLAAALPLPALLLLGGLAVTVLAVVLANSVVRRRPRQHLPGDGPHAGAG